MGPQVWQNQFTPEADTCVVNLACSYEEQIDIPLAPNIRWYEQGAGVVLWWMSAEPQPSSQYSPMFSVNNAQSKSYSQLWGRGPEISSMIGAYFLYYYC